MLALMVATLLLLATHPPSTNTAANDPEATTLGSIAELLNPDECHELYIRLALPQEEAKQALEEDDLFPQNQWQDIISMDQCKGNLRHWLEMQGGAIDWDRLARALRQIGRPDISRELKKSLNKNRSLEPKWKTGVNQTTRATPKSAALIGKKAPSRRRRHGPLQRHRKTSLKDTSWDLRAFFLQLLPVSLHSLTLQHCIGPAIQLLIASFLAGLVLWLVSVYYIVCWNLQQCLFASGVHYNTAPARQNMNLTVFWNHPSGRGFPHDGEDLGTSEDEDETEEQAAPSDVCRKVDLIK